MTGFRLSRRATASGLKWAACIFIRALLLSRRLGAARAQPQAQPSATSNAIAAAVPT